MLLRERPGERLMPWSAGEASAHAVNLHSGAWKPIILGVLRAMAKGPTLLYMAAAFLASSFYGIFLGLAPLLGVRFVGWSDAQVSSLSSTGNLLAAGFAVVVAGLLADRIGARRMAMVFYALVGIVAAAMALAQGMWQAPMLFTVFVIAFLVLDTSSHC